MYNFLKGNIDRIFLEDISVEHDPVSGSRSNRILQFRTGSGSDWISKNSTGSDLDIQTALISAVKYWIRVFFRIWTGLDQIFGQVYRIRIRPDYSTKTLDWIRIAIISNLFNTRGHTYNMQHTVWQNVFQIPYLKLKTQLFCIWVA